MGARSSIEWTESTWNPVTGCSKVSPGCLNCYAERMAKRLQAMGHPNYADGFAVRVHPRSLGLPMSWKSPQIIFVNSMSDLFHEEIPFRFIEDVFEVMNRLNRHRYQVLTKRSERLRGLSSRLDWPDHVWMGVSVENADYLGRIEDLRQTGAAVKFLSLEPLLGPLENLDLSGIDWVIVGGESGPGARPMAESWVLGIRDQCDEAGVPFFFKQWGGTNKKKSGRRLQGRTHDDMPCVAGRTPVQAMPGGTIPHKQ